VDWVFAPQNKNTAEHHNNCHIQCIVIIHNLYINWHNLSISRSGYDRKCLVLTIQKIYNPPYFTHIYCCTQVLFSRTSYIYNCNIWYLQWLAAIRSLYLTTDYHNDHLPSHYVPTYIIVLWLVPNSAVWWQTNNDLNNFSANLTSDKEIMSSTDIRKAWTYVSSLACIGLDWAVFYVPANTVIGYMEDGFYRSKDPTNSIKVLKVHIVHRQIKHTIIKR